MAISRCGAYAARLEMAKAAPTAAAKGKMGAWLGRSPTARFKPADRCHRFNQGD